MNRGSRVRTPAGDGTVIQIRESIDWNFGKPHRSVWAWVRLDDGGIHAGPPADITELEAETPWPE